MPSSPKRSTDASPRPSDKFGPRTSSPANQKGQVLFYSFSRGDKFRKTHRAPEPRVALRFFDGFSAGDVVTVVYLGSFDLKDETYVVSSQGSDGKELVRTESAGSAATELKALLSPQKLLVPVEKFKLLNETRRRLNASLPKDPEIVRITVSDAFTSSGIFPLVPTFKPRREYQSQLSVEDGGYHPLHAYEGTVGKITSLEASKCESVSRVLEAGRSVTRLVSSRYRSF